jgi:uncharacterized membrane protein YhaH (DUF805 family)
MIFGAAAMALFMFFAIIGVALLVFEIMMFVDAIQNKRLTDTEKWLWCIAMICLFPLVAVFYYFIARSGLEGLAQDKD